MIYKVLQVDMIKGTATIGDDASGTMEAHPLSDFKYTPNIGDAVNVYRQGTETMILLAEDHAKEDDRPSQKVNRLVYALLAFFLGDLGIHHFYAGDSARGVKYLLLSIFLSWTIIVPIVIWFKCIFQGVRVLSMPSDPDGNVILYHNF